MDNVMYLSILGYEHRWENEVCLIPEDFSFIPEVAYHNVTPKTLLGEERANDEWILEGDQNWKPLDTFLHIDSYQAFKLPGSLFLFGRRGTGKTAMIKMLAYEANSGKIPCYLFSHIIDEEAAYHKLSILVQWSMLGNIPNSDLIYLLSEMWTWILNVGAISELIEPDRFDLESDEKACVSNFLMQQKLVGNGSGIDENAIYRVTTTFTEQFEFIHYNLNALAAAVLKANEKLFTQEFKDAKAVLIKVLKRKNSNCVVMVDSINYFRPKDNIQIAIFSGLIKATLYFYENKNRDRIIAKIALPSELYPYLEPENREHVEGKNLLILWKYQDLVNFLAKRLWFYTNRDADKESFKKFEKFEYSQSFIYELLPSLVESSKGMQFDTLAYVIRHTQKKPRQLIMLFNTILTLAELFNEDVRKKTLTPETIRKGIHARLDMLVTGSFHIYNHIFPGAEKLIRRTLTEANSFFPYAELDKYMVCV
jgi:hypothetical protein